MTDAALNPFSPEQAAALTGRLLAQLQDKATSNPFDANVLETIYAAAYAELEAGRYDKAEKLFAFLTGQCPSDSRFVEGLGLAYARQDNLPGAWFMLALACGLEPRSPSPMLQLAELLAAEGLVSLALPLLDAAQTLAAMDGRYRDIQCRAQALMELFNERPLE